MQKGKADTHLRAAQALGWIDAVKESATPTRPQSLPAAPYLAPGTLLVQVFPDAALLWVRQHQGALPQQPLGIFLCRFQSPQAVITGCGGTRWTGTTVRKEARALGKTA